MKEIIKIVGTVVLLGNLTMASNTTSSTLTVEALSTNKVMTLSVDTSYYCDPIERLMGMCRSSKILPLEN